MVDGRLQAAWVHPQGQQVAGAGSSTSRGPWSTTVVIRAVVLSLVLRTSYGHAGGGRSTGG